MRVKRVPLYLLSYLLLSMYVCYKRTKNKQKEKEKNKIRGVRKLPKKSTRDIKNKPKNRDLIICEDKSLRIKQRYLKI